MTWPAAGAGLSIKALGQPTFEALVHEQRARGLSPHLVARQATVVRGFCRFLVLDRRLSWSPADTTWRDSVRSRRP